MACLVAVNGGPEGHLTAGSAQIQTNGVIVSNLFPSPRESTVIHYADHMCMCVDAVTSSSATNLSAKDPFFHYANRSVL